MFPKNNLMIVCHPDDEVLWGSKLLERNVKWEVVVLTNGNNHLRKEKYLKCLKIYNQKGIILNFIDQGKWKEETIKEIKEYLNHNTKLNEYNSIVTHNPDGEYGHNAHIQLSEIVFNLVKDKSKLSYFTFSKSKQSLSDKNLEALKVYYGRYRFKKYFFDQSKRFISIGVNNYYFKKITRLSRISFIFDKIESKIESKIIDLNYINQEIQLSQHSSTVNCEEYKSNEKLIKNIYKQPYILYDKKDVFRHFKSLYEEYPARNYLSKSFLPDCKGNVLNIGCHEFNKWDHLLVQNPESYHTIDLDINFENFGSPFHHQTIDYIDYSPEYKFSNIILFGVLGIPDNNEIFSLYSLYKNELKVIEKTDKLLSLGGRVLFGPDYVVDKSVNGISKWGNFFNNNEILKRKYTLEFKLEGKCNLIYVYKKVKE